MNSTISHQLQLQPHSHSPIPSASASASASVPIPASDSLSSTLFPLPSRHSIGSTVHASGYKYRSACDFCAARRRACSKHRPRCHLCIKLGRSECVYQLPNHRFYESIPVIKVNESGELELNPLVAADPRFAYEVEEKRSAIIKRLEQLAVENSNHDGGINSISPSQPDTANENSPSIDSDSYSTESDSSESAGDEQAFTPERNRHSRSHSRSQSKNKFKFSANSNSNPFSHLSGFSFVAADDSVAFPSIGVPGPIAIPIPPDAEISVGLVIESPRSRALQLLLRDSASARKDKKRKPRHFLDLTPAELSEANELAIALGFRPVKRRSNIPGRLHKTHPVAIARKLKKENYELSLVNNADSSQLQQTSQSQNQNENEPINNTKSNISNGREPKVSINFPPRSSKKRNEIQQENKFENKRIKPAASGRLAFHSPQQQPANATSAAAAAAAASSAINEFSVAAAARLAEAHPKLSMQVNSNSNSSPSPNHPNPNHNPNPSSVPHSRVSVSHPKVSWPAESPELLDERRQENSTKKFNGKTKQNNSATKEIENLKEFSQKQHKSAVQIKKPTTIINSPPISSDKTNSIAERTEKKRQTDKRTAEEATAATARTAATQETRGILPNSTSAGESTAAAVDLPVRRLSGRGISTRTRPTNAESSKQFREIQTENLAEQFDTQMEDEEEEQQNRTSGEQGEYEKSGFNRNHQPDHFDDVDYDNENDIDHADSHSFLVSPANPRDSQFPSAAQRFVPVIIRPANDESAAHRHSHLPHSSVSASASASGPAADELLANDNSSIADLELLVESPRPKQTFPPAIQTRANNYQNPNQHQHQSQHHHQFNHSDSTSLLSVRGRPQVTSSISIPIVDAGPAEDQNSLNPEVFYNSVGDFSEELFAAANRPNNAISTINIRNSTTPKNRSRNKSVHEADQVHQSRSQSSSHHQSPPVPLPHPAAVDFAVPKPRFRGEFRSPNPIQMNYQNNPINNYNNFNNNYPSAAHNSINGSGSGNAGNFNYPIQNQYQPQQQPQPHQQQPQPEINQNYYANQQYFNPQTQFNRNSPAPIMFSQQQQMQMQPYNQPHYYPPFLPSPHPHLHPQSHSQQPQYYSSDPQFLNYSHNQFINPNQLYSNRIQQQPQQQQQQPHYQHQHPFIVDFPSSIPPVATRFGSEVYQLYEDSIRSEQSFLNSLDPQLHNNNEVINNIMRIIFAADHDGTNKCAIFDKFFDRLNSGIIDKNQFKSLIQQYHGIEIAKYSKWIEPGDSIPPIDDGCAGPNGEFTYDKNSSNRAIWLIQFCCMISIGIISSTPLSAVDAESHPSPLFQYARISFQLGFFFFKRVWWHVGQLITRCDDKNKAQFSHARGSKAAAASANSAAAARSELILLLVEVSRSFGLLYQNLKLFSNQKILNSIGKIGEEIDSLRTKLEENQENLNCAPQNAFRRTAAWNNKIAN